MANERASGSGTSLRLEPLGQASFCFFLFASLARARCFPRALLSRYATIDTTCLPHAAAPLVCCAGERFERLMRPPLTARRASFRLPRRRRRRRSTWPACAPSGTRRRRRRNLSSAALAQIGATRAAESQRATFAAYLRANNFCFNLFLR